LRDGIAAPSNVPVRPDKHHALCIKASRLGIADMFDAQGQSATFGCRTELMEILLLVAKGQQGETGAKKIKDRCPIGQPQVGRAMSGACSWGVLAASCAGSWVSSEIKIGESEYRYPRCASIGANV
jgi:hypothetical protein